MVRLGDGFEALNDLEVQLACLCGLPAGLGVRLGAT